MGARPASWVAQKNCGEPPDQLPSEFAAHPIWRVMQPGLMGDQCDVRFLRLTPCAPVSVAHLHKGDRTVKFVRPSRPADTATTNVYDDERARRWTPTRPCSLSTSPGEVRLSVGGLGATRSRSRFGTTNRTTPLYHIDPECGTRVTFGLLRARQPQHPPSQS